ncbi:MAG: tRNA (adenosine(37)-N6)-threonylcarbamoyltransferase complex ATPase subunit type 1 TsaE [Candidatus Tectomicrobia bacterium]|uniref:tRNA threonylcarbamoyladenosine biosynthesis protein TsaE n=1 Tax=Tectimicrobiota bacterium TaxID=2528274 RepID=A0A932CN84_UNCTE|nr:tRNA (adenosine(37)-N6)-threonylcarbamoyltransferase complex ATPase subunit type 1 TsaE [Candidatus Tectomicrobia bacterium]
MVLISSSPEETRTIGEEIGRTLGPGTVVCLYGELGVGKTCLIQGLARGLGVKEEREVKSPTFVLIREYEGTFPIYHFDLYRIESAQELEGLGYEEYFYGRGVTLIEWADRLEEQLPPDRIEIHLTFLEEDRRRIEVIEQGSRGKAGNLIS